MGAATFDELKVAWARSEPRRASGGWWALSGFTTQFLITLAVVLRSVLIDGKAVTDADVETLSDAALSTGDGHRLIQVKRTLNRSSAVDAVREACLIFELADASLRKTLTLQIACENLVDDIDLSTIAATDVFKSPTPQQAALLTDTLARFDADTPILRSQDPRSALVRVLWKVGVDNPQGLIADALGRLMGTFDGRDRKGLENALFDVIDRVKSAVRDRPMRTAGQILLAQDFAREPQAGLPAIGAQPRIYDVAAGRYRERTSLATAAREAFVAWHDALPSASSLAERLPIFCIDGRPGDGKSVLLLQLLQSLFADGRLVEVVSLRSAIDLFELVRRLPLASTTEDADEPFLLCIIDDLHARLDPAQFDEAYRAATELGPRRIALMTCGPSYEIAHFSKLARTAAFVRFRVPPPSTSELLELKAWSETRGVPFSAAQHPKQGQLLVGWMAQVAQNESLEEFSAKFRDDLRRARLEETARSIIALNALGFGAPAELISGTTTDIALAQFASAHLVLFERTEEQGADVLYLAHPELVWPMFEDWTNRDGEDLPSVWGREIARSVVNLLMSGRAARARRIFGRLIDGPPVADRLGRSYEQHIQYLRRRQLLEAAWRSVAQQGRRSEAAVLLPLLLSAIRGERFGQMERDCPVHAAREAIDDPRETASSKAEIAMGLIGLSGGPICHARAVAFAESWLDLHAAEPSVVAVMTQLARKSRDGAGPFVVRWLCEHATDASTWPALVAGLRGDNAPLLFRSALLSLELDPDRAAPIAEALLPHASKDMMLARSMISWAFKTSKPSTAAKVMQILVANPNTSRAGDRRVAIKWLEAHPEASDVVEVYRNLLKLRMPGSRLSKAIGKWLARHSNTLAAANVLRELVTQPSTRRFWLDQADEAARTWDDEIRVIVLAETIKRVPSIDRIHTALAFAAAGKSRHAKYLLGVVQDKIGHLGGPQILQGRLSELEEQELVYAMGLSPKGRG